MMTFTGTSISCGLAIGIITFYRRGSYTVGQYPINDVEKELNRFEYAKNKAVNELKSLYNVAVDKVGKLDAQIFEIHQAMIEDIIYNENVIDIIKQDLVNAEYAVAVTAKKFVKIFAEMADCYIGGRSADVMDISRRIERHLLNINETYIDFDDGSIVVADDLVPSETVQLDKSKVMAFVTKGGTVDSHTAILAKNMDIPALICVDNMNDDINGKLAIVDGIGGELYIEPDENTMKTISAKYDCSLLYRNLDRMRANAFIER